LTAFIISSAVIGSGQDTWWGGSIPSQHGNNCLERNLDTVMIPRDREGEDGKAATNFIFYAFITPPGAINKTILWVLLLLSPKLKKLTQL
jgi:hypothetical protein